VLPADDGGIAAARAGIEQHVEHESRTTALMEWFTLSLNRS
jgi:hypothetical protein